MKNSILITAVFLFCTASIFAQHKDDYASQGHYKNFTLAISGVNITQGLHYDMRFKKGQPNGLGFKAGVGGFSVRRIVRVRNVEEGLLSLPIQLNYIVGKKRHGLELGLGVLPAFATVDNTEIAFGNERIAINDFEMIGSLATIGYKFQPRKNGIAFGINYNTVVTPNSGIQSYLGVQIGISFK